MPGARTLHRVKSLFKTSVHEHAARGRPANKNGWQLSPATTEGDYWFDLLRNIALRRRFESFRQDLGADKAGHCLANGEVVALGEVDPIHPIGRHNFASVEKRNLKEPGQVAIVLSQLDNLFPAALEQLKNQGVGIAARGGGAISSTLGAG